MYFLLLLCIPAIEIWLFVIIGQSIGILTTLLMCLLTAVIGISLARVQGLLTLKNLAMQPHKISSQISNTIVQGGLLLVAGISLLIPGFFSDAIGFMLLIPFIRRKVSEYIEHHFTLPVKGTHAQTPPSPDIIEGDYTVCSDETPPKTENSPWLSKNNS